MSGGVDEDSFWPSFQLRPQSHGGTDGSASAAEDDGSEDGSVPLRKPAMMRKPSAASAKPKAKPKTRKMILKRPAAVMIKASGADAEVAADVLDSDKSGEHDDDGERADESPPLLPARSEDGEEEKTERKLGCSKCRYAVKGCGRCRARAASSS